MRRQVAPVVARQRGVLYRPYSAGPDRYRRPALFCWERGLYDGLACKGAGMARVYCLPFDGQCASTVWTLLRQQPGSYIID